MKKQIFSVLILFILNTLSSQTLTPTDKLALLKGLVTNFKGKILSNEIILFSNDQTKAIFKTTTDANGKFELLIPVKATYSLKYKTFTSEQDYTKMTVPDTKNATFDVKIKIDPPKSYVLDHVYFDTGKSTLKTQSFKALADLVEVLKLKSTMVIEIQGHTDNVGDETENLNLSQARAEAVMNYLISKGINQSRIMAKGYGATMPIADNASDVGKSKNRRTSLKVLKDY